MNKLSKLGPILIALAAILWGIDGVLRRTLFELPPIIIVFYEHLIGSLLILPFLLPKVFKQKFTPKDILALLVISLLSGVLGTLWFTTALFQVNFIPFSVVFLLQKLQPLFAISAAAIILKEKIPPSFIKWAALALIAAYFVTFKNGQVNFDTGPKTFTAAAFALGAAIAWGSSTALSRWALLRHPQTIVTGLRFIFTAILSSFFVLFLGQTSSILSPTITQIYRLIVIAFSTGLFALWIYYQGLKHTQAKVSTIVELLFPLTAITIDIFLYQNFLAPSQYLASAILLYSIYRVSKQNLRHVAQ